MNQIFDNLALLETEIERLNVALETENKSNAFFRLITKKGIKNNIEKSRKLQKSVNKFKEIVQQETKD